jgi:hypothetical protein
MLDIIIKKIKPLRFLLERKILKNSSNEEYLRSIKDKLKGKPVIIVGNGPSLNITPLDVFKDIPAIGMNKIDLIYKRIEWRPSMVVCTNGIVMKQHKSYYNRTKITTFLGYKARYFGVGKKNENVKYFLESPDADFQEDITKGMGSCGTVTYNALQLAYYLGANPVIIFGVDHSFKTEVDTRANQIVMNKTEDVNHFDPNYFEKGTYWGVPNLDKSEKGYLEAKGIFEADGRKVYDATIGGKLDIFPKISLEEAKRIINENK